MENEHHNPERDPGSYLGIVVVDAEKFSHHNDVAQGKLQRLIPRVLRQAAQHSDLAQLWDERHFPASRGDGYLFGFPHGLIPQVLDRYLDALQNELRLLAPKLRKENMTLRLRASVHLGLVRDFDRLLADSPAGKTMTDSSRMVDADPVRTLLTQSDPNVTFLAAVVSEEVMKLVQAGHSRRHASEFVAAPLRVEGKEYTGVGYLRVPVPSGELLAKGLLCGQPTEPEAEPERSGERTGPIPVGNGRSTTNTTGDVHNGRVNQVGDMAGGIEDRSVNASGNSGKMVMVNGIRHTVAEGSVDQSTGKQEFSGHFTTQGDSNFGPHSGRRVPREQDADDRDALGRMS